MMADTVIGVDLAKHVFQLHGASRTGEVPLREKLSRSQFHRFMGGQKPCIVATEACGSSHYWAREMQRLGHEMKLIAPRYVKPFVKLCSPRHNFTNHEVAIMRRNSRKAPISGVFPGVFCALFVRAKRGLWLSR